MALLSRFSGHDRPTYRDHTVDDSDVIYRDIDNSTESERSAKRRRIESYAESYLLGADLFLLSASLKGPFEGTGWDNPWKSKGCMVDEPTTSNELAGFAQIRTNGHTQSFQSREDLRAAGQISPRKSSRLVEPLAQDSTDLCEDIVPKKALASVARLQNAQRRMLSNSLAAKSSDAAESGRKRGICRDRPCHRGDRTPRPATSLDSPPVVATEAGLQLFLSTSGHLDEAVDGDQSLAFAQEQSVESDTTPHSVDADPPTIASHGAEKGIHNIQSRSPSPLSPIKDVEALEKWASEAQVALRGNINPPGTISGSVIVITGQDGREGSDANERVSVNAQQSDCSAASHGQVTHKDMRLADIEQSSANAITAIAPVNLPASTESLPLDNSLMQIDVHRTVSHDIFETATSLEAAEQPSDSVYELPPTPTSDRSSEKFSSAQARLMDVSIIHQSSEPSLPEHQDSRAYSTLSFEGGSHTQGEIAGLERPSCSPPAKILRISDIRSPARRQQRITDYTSARPKATGSAAPETSSHYSEEALSACISFKSWTVSKPTLQEEKRKANPRNVVSFDDEVEARQSSAPTPPPDSPIKRRDDQASMKRSCLKRSSAPLQSIGSEPPMVSFVPSLAQTSAAESVGILGSSHQMAQKMFASEQPSAGGNHHMEMDILLDNMSTFLDDNYSS